MTIKEIEERSGLARANIRFYEKEGLISPVRQENGYRDYSEKELEELEKIKLLRALDLSVEAIREAKAGKQSLTELLEAHLSYLGVETVRYQAAQKTCQKMCRDGVSYENLQAAQYLHDLHSFPAVKQDQVPRVRSPWRRFLARELDYDIYFSLCYMAILLFVPYTKIQDSVFQKLVLPFLIFLLMFLIEPLLLMKFGTTPGKWILGLRVTNPDDGCLRYTDGLSRMWGVIACGYGFGIPIYRIYRLIRSYLTCCDSEEVLPWEEDSVVVLKDTKSYRAAIYLMVCVLLIGMRVFEGYMQVIPKHRGDLTVQEYAENYNWFSDVSGLDHRLTLEETGDWRTQEDEWGVRKELPDYEYTLDGERERGRYLFSSGIPKTRGNDAFLRYGTNYSNFSFRQSQRPCFLL